MIRSTIDDGNATLPSIHDASRYWDPLLSIANETGMPICMHIGSSSTNPTTAPDAPTLVTFALRN